MPHNSNDANPVIRRDEHAAPTPILELDLVSRTAAPQAVAILRDVTTPGDLSIPRTSDFAHVVNMDVIRALDRILPFDFLKVAQSVPD